MKKIKILKTEKTKEAVATEFASIQQQQNKLLSDSMWTQLADSGLKTSIMFRWQVWRSKLRAIKANQFNDPEKFAETIETLKRNQPPTIYADTMEPVIIPMTMIRTDSVEQCIRSILIATQAIKSISGENSKRSSRFISENISLKLDATKTIEENLEIFYEDIDCGY